MQKARMSRRKIAYDLKTSPYYTELYYVNLGKFKITEVNEGTKICFVFSSERYLKKFTDELQENRLKISESLSNRFKYSIKCNLLADLKLYIDIEKRGFLLLVNGEKVDCLENITLDGNNLIVMN